MPIPIARVAWYVTGRFYEDENEQLMDLGYFLHLSGVEGSLFTGQPPSESTAVLTFRSAPFAAQSITNGNMGIGLDAKGEFSLYLNPAGGASFEDPDSFSRGKRIALFRRVSVVMGGSYFLCIRLRERSHPGTYPAPQARTACPRDGRRISGGGGVPLLGS